MATTNQLGAIDHVVILMLENRSFDHMLGFLYADRANQSLSGQPFEGLTGTETNPTTAGETVPVSRITAAMPHPYLMPGADPGEGFLATNSQLYGSGDSRRQPARDKQRIRHRFRVHAWLGVEGSELECDARHNPR